MRIDCLHGYFIFTESKAGQISRFISLYGLDLERSGDHFTFADLVDAPRYSIEGGTFLGARATKTFSGDPWEVMRVNRLVYDFNRGLVVSVDLIVQTVKLSQAGYYMLTSGMILPGSFMEDGSRVTDYAAHYIAELGQFRYSEVGA